MKILNNLYSKFFKKPFANDAAQHVKNRDNVIAYANIAITDDNDMLLCGDFSDGHESDMAKLIFLLSSGSLSNFIIQILMEKCGEESEITQKVLLEAESLMEQYLKTQILDDEDDDEPVVDPCNVFRTTGEAQHE